MATGIEVSTGFINEAILPILKKELPSDYGRTNRLIRSCRRSC